MNNQQVNQQNLSNNSSAEIPPPQKVFAFKDLPPQVQGKLFQLQNTDGEFLKTSNSVTASRIILLILLAFGFILFLTNFENVAFDWRVILIFAVGALIFALCASYLAWRLFKTMRSPVRNQSYLTPTQVIETTDGQIRYRKLKDATEISVNRYWSDIGKRSSMDIKFADGDIFGFKLEINNNSAQLVESEKWRAQAQVWKDEAVAAFERGDAAYFDERDIFQKSLSFIFNQTKDE